MSETTPRLLLDVDQAAEALGIGTTLLRQMVARREIPVVRINRRTLIPISGLERWVEEHTESAAPASHPFAKGLSVTG